MSSHSAPASSGLKFQSNIPWSLAAEAAQVLSETQPQSNALRASEHDAELLGRVRSYLYTRRIGVLKGLDIDVHQGTVHIAGRVSSYYEKQLILHSAARVAGVTRVVADLLVVPREQPVEEVVIDSRSNEKRQLPLVALSLAATGILILFAIGGRGQTIESTRQAAVSDLSQQQ